VAYRAWNGGLSFEQVADDYEAGLGEAVFDHEPTGDDLSAAFTVEHLARIKANAIARIDREIERARLHFVTGVFGQDTIYKDKLIEARAVLAEIAGGGSPEPDDVDAEGLYLYRYLRQEIGATGATLTEVAEVVAGLGVLWNGRLSPPLEGCRIVGKFHADQATDAVGVETIVGLVTDAVTAIGNLPEGPTLADQVDATLAAIVWPTTAA